MRSDHAALAVVREEECNRLESEIVELFRSSKKLIGRAVSFLQDRWVECSRGC